MPEQSTDSLRSNVNVDPRKHVSGRKVGAAVLVAVGMILASVGVSKSNGNTAPDRSEVPTVSVDKPQAQIREAVTIDQKVSAADASQAITDLSQAKPPTAEIAPAVDPTASVESEPEPEPEPNDATSAFPTESSESMGSDRLTATADSNTADTSATVDTASDDGRGEVLEDPAPTVKPTFGDYVPVEGEPNNAIPIDDAMQHQIIDAASGITPNTNIPTQIAGAAVVENHN